MILSCSAGGEKRGQGAAAELQERLRETNDLEEQAIIKWVPVVLFKK